jgi:hypothetical protein
MEFRRVVIAAIAFAFAFAVSGCSHRVVAKQGDTNVLVYQSEDIYKSAKSLEESIRTGKIGGLKGTAGAILGYAQSHEAELIDTGTRVKILSRDADGAQVEVMEGPNKGYQGFLPKENLD